MPFNRWKWTLSLWPWIFHPVLMTLLCFDSSFLRWAKDLCQCKKVQLCRKRMSQIPQCVFLKAFKCIYFSSNLASRPPATPATPANRFGLISSSTGDTSDGWRPSFRCHSRCNLSFINRLLEFSAGGEKKKLQTAPTWWTSDLLQYSVSPGNLFQVIEGTKQICLAAFSKMKRSL